MSKKIIQKGTVQETLLIPLYGRKLAMEMYPGNFNNKDSQWIFDQVEMSYEDKKGLIFKHLDKSNMCQIIEISFV